MNRRERRAKPLRKHQQLTGHRGGNPTLAVVTVCVTSLIIVVIAALAS
jgi:hypothetical protein